jgi:OPT family oligopeptide transporter
MSRPSPIPASSVAASVDSAAPVEEGPGLRRDPLAPPGTPQLTVRAVLTGMALGGVMSLSNLYVALKAGWSFGVTITAGILAFSFWNLVRRGRPATRDFGILENNAMQSVASAAGYMTGGGTVAAIPALMMLTGQPMHWTVMLPWVTLLALLGVFVAIPMKRQMIDVEQLRFPSGIAAAETLRSLHHAAGEGIKKARALGLAGVFGALVGFLRDHPFKWLALHLPDKVGLGFTIAGKPALDFTFALESSVLLVGAGAIMGMRVAWSQLLGAVINYGFMAPWAHSIGAVEKLGYKGIVGWSVWFGSSLLLSSGLLAFALTWRSVARALGSVGKVLKSGAETVAEAEAAQEVPFRWFLWGLVLVGPLEVLAQWAFFGIAPWLGAIAVLLSLFIAIVACRSTGETDTTPTGALGKITQLTFGALDPGNVHTNLMTANVTGGAAIHSADLLTDLKSGWLLGANPRQQFQAQFFGVIAGALFVVPAYMVLVPTAASVGTDELPAPAAQTWAAVAQALAKGIGTLHVTARWSIAVGAAVGVLLVLAERAFPKAKKWIPSAMGLGLAFTMPAWNSISMFVGAVLAWGLAKWRADLAERYVVPVSSGLIAGESLMGIAIAFLFILERVMG